MSSDEPSAAPHDYLIGAKAIAEFLGLTVSAVNNKIFKGQLPAFRWHGHVVVRRSDLLREIERAADTARHGAANVASPEAKRSSGRPRRQWPEQALPKRRATR